MKKHYFTDVARAALTLNMVALLVVGHPAREARADSPSAEQSLTLGAVQPSVDTQTGGVSYDYGFTLPPGRDGFTPSLNLSYNSGRRASWVGWGFVLGNPRIRRDTRNGIPDLNCGVGAPAVGCFVVDDGGSIAALVPVGPIHGDPSGTAGFEYRTARDLGDVQYIFFPGNADGNPSQNRWMRRTRDGVVVFFSASQALLQSFRVAYGNSASTYAWDETLARDRHGNTIDYRYSVQGFDRRPRVADIWYGGNDGSTGAPLMPHLFHVALHRDGDDPIDPILASNAPAPFQCGNREIDHGGPLGSDPLGPRDSMFSYRSGGSLEEEGGTNVLRAIGVEVAWPGSTDAPTHTAATRRVRYWQLRYNWDRVGCHNTDQLWPLLESIEEHVADEAGVEETRPPVSFDYYGWDRTIGNVGSVDLSRLNQPPSVNVYIDASRHIAPMTPPRGIMVTAGGAFDNPFGPGFAPAQIVAAADGVVPATCLTPGPGCSPRYPTTGVGRVSGLMDVNFDGVADVVDLTQGQSCFTGGIAGGAARWAPLFGTGTSQVDTVAADPSAPRILGWFASSVQNAPFTNLTGGSDSALSSCALDTRRMTHGNTGATFDSGATPGIIANDVVFADVDGDGWVDLIRNEGSEVSSSWNVHRNVYGSGGSLSSPYATTALPIAFMPWTVAATSTSSDQGFYRGRFNDQYVDVPGDGGASMTNELSANSGSRELSAEADYLFAGSADGAWGGTFGVTTDSAGYIGDVTGDSVPDRVSVTQGAPGGAGTIVVYPGAIDVEGRLLFQAGNAWALPSEWIPAAPVSLLNSTVSEGLYPYQTWTETWQGSSVVDLNGDGLPDLLTDSIDPFLQGPSNQPTTLVAALTSYLNRGNAFGTPVNYEETQGGRPFARNSYWMGYTWTTYRYADIVENVNGSSSVRSTRLVDFNGDGLPDFISADGTFLGLDTFAANPAGVSWHPTGTSSWFPNVGGYLDLGPTSQAYVLPTPSGASWMELSQATIAATGSSYTSYQQLVDDFTGDGRPDILSLNPSGTATLFTDLDSHAAPGRLRAVHLPSGARIEFRYQSMQEALGNTASSSRGLPGDGPALPGVPGGGWVVSRKTVFAAETDPTGLVTSYRYRSPHLDLNPDLVPDGSGGLRPIARGGAFLGFGMVAACNPIGTEEVTHYEFSDPTVAGLPVEHDTFAGCEGLQSQGSSRIVSQTTTNYSATAVQAALPLLGRVVRPRVGSVQRTTFDLNGTSSSDQWTSRTFYQYLNATNAVTLQVESAPGSPPRQTTTTFLATHDDTNLAQSYLLPPAATEVRYVGDSSAARRSSFAYDGMSGDFGAGDPTTMTQYRADGDAGEKTALQRDAFGHVTVTTSPMGRVSRTCWDSRGMYPVYQEAPSTLATLTTYSTVSGLVLEEHGPTGVARLASCPGVDASVPNFGSPSLPPLTFPVGMQEIVSALTPPTATPVPPGMVTTPTVGTGPGGTGTPPPPSSSVTYQYESVRPDMALAAPPSERQFCWRDLWGTRPSTVSSYSPPGSAPIPTAPGTRTTRDGWGRPTRVEVTDRDPTSGVLSWTTLSTSGYVDTPPLSRTTFTTIDAARSAHRSVTYDGLGRVTQQSQLSPDASSTVSVTFGYDLHTGRAYTTTYPNPDSAGSPSVVTDTIAGRDALGRVTSIAFADGSRRNYQYRENAYGHHEVMLDGGMVQMTAADSDGFGRLVARTAGASPGTTTTFAYDAAGAPASTMWPSGAVTTRTLDQRGLETQKSRYASASTVTSSTPLATWMTFSDDDGAVASTAGPDGRGLQFTYEPGSGRLQTSHPYGGPALFGQGDHVTVYQDNRNLDGAGQPYLRSTATEQDAFVYNARADVSKVSIVTTLRAPTGATFTEKLQITETYTQGGLTASTAVAVGGGPSHTFLYDHDSQGNTWHVTDSVPGAISRALQTDVYGATGRLETRTDGWGGSETTLYDVSGLRRARTVTGTGTTPAFSESIAVTRDGHWMPQDIDEALGDGYAVSLSNVFDDQDRVVHIADGDGHYALTASYDHVTGRRSSLVEGIDGAVFASESVYGTPAAGVDPDEVTSIVDGRGNLVVQPDHDQNGYVVARHTALGSTTYDTSADGEVCTASDGSAFLYDAAGLRAHAFIGTSEVSTITGLFSAVYSLSGGTYVMQSCEFLGTGSLTPAIRVDGFTGNVVLQHLDLHSNVVVMRRLPAVPGSAGAAITYQEYSAFGTLLHRGGSPSGAQDVWGYHGGVSSGMDPNILTFGYRQYDLLARAWMARDPLEGDRPYEFLGGNPFVFVDPLGLMLAPDPDHPSPFANQLGVGGSGGTDPGLEPIAPDPAPSEEEEENARGWDRLFRRIEDVATAIETWSNHAADDSHGDGIGLNGPTAGTGGPSLPQMAAPTVGALRDVARLGRGVSGIGRGGYEMSPLARGVGVVVGGAGIVLTVAPLVGEVGAAGRAAEATAAPLIEEAIANGAVRRLATEGDTQFRTAADALAEALSRFGIDPGAYEVTPMFGRNPNLIGPQGQPWEIIRGIDFNGEIIPIDNHANGHYYRDSGTFELPHYHGPNGEHLTY